MKQECKEKRRGKGGAGSKKREKENQKKDIGNIPEVETESDVIESKEETIVRKEIC